MMPPIMNLKFWLKRKMGGYVITHGWCELDGVYSLNYDNWVTLVYMCLLDERVYCVLNEW